MQRHMPIGYKLVDGKVVFNAEKVAVVQKIFKDYLNGTSMIAIAKELTAAGFLNANNKPNWNHGSVGKILENTKYLGDTMYPQIIDNKTFKLVQQQRKSKNKKLGRTPQINTRKNQSIFTSKLKCGECGAIYRKYIEHAGRPSEKSNWKCKRYIYQNRVHCRNLFLTEKDIENIFISATNKILSRMWMLDKEKKKEPPKMTMEIRNLEERIKELEDEKQFSSRELAELIFKRAKAYYHISKIDDYDHNTKKIKEEFLDRKPLTEFDEELFQNVVKEITIYKDGKIQVKYINGMMVEEDYEDIRKDE
ncbi:Recombinase zinc beta ribbon domain-containing protein [Tissierella praeacuta DSM 18095]|uniref:Recombinase zinc beta ribbon domain-containing protein n=1 Tax=Tissierella praeacuta DSM 18095 TaxID=1123404 RepID=A0A1M4X9H3_9FIRM|nr:recombinase family protein [Tissierella praeacuta]SHE90159.1 Recombinase zinc beta ribbon domain-containing protein [Tissierella praeacuta DSM 18095]SUP02549.1 Recombinase [Tissierella praeacuta]